MVRAHGPGWPLFAFRLFCHCPMIPKKFEPLLFGLILYGLMSLVVSGIATVRITGIGPGLAGLWFRKSG